MDEIRRIPLSQGMYAIVDADDYDKVAGRKWSYHAYKMGVNGYAVSGVNTKLRLAYELMHRLILGTDSPLEVDHINHCGLDNRKCNLRFVTRKENVWNSKREPRKSGAIGVQASGPYGFSGTLCRNGKRWHSKTFKTVEEALAAREAKLASLLDA